MPDNDTSNRTMDSQEAQRKADEIAKRYGLKTEQSDIDTLATKNPEDQARYLSDLEAQAQRRAAPTSHRTQDSQSGQYDTQTHQAIPGTQAYAAESGGGGRPGSAVASWMGAPAPAPPAAGPDPALTALYQQQLQMMEQLRADQQAAAAEQLRRQQENDARRDSLYNTLLTRSQQSLNVDPNDPIIKQQVDGYAAEQERARRNMISDAAEARQPLGETQRAMSHERVGRNAGSLKAELMARLLQSKRGEISEALSGMAGVLTNDQQAALQRELSGYDNAIRQQQLGISNRELDIRQQLGLGELDLGRGRLSLEGELGRGGLSNDLLRTLLGNQQFYSDLGSQNDRFTAQMGFNASDRARYWDALNSGLLD